MSNFLFGLCGPDIVNCSQKTEYESRSRMSCAFSGVWSGNDSGSSAIVLIVLDALVGELGSKGLAESKLLLVSDVLSALVVIARLRLLRFFSLSSVLSVIPRRDDRDSLFDAHLVSCETVLARRNWGGGAREGYAVVKEELELEPTDALSSRR